MKKTIWCREAFILLWVCGMTGCQEKPENLPVRTPIRSTSNVMMPAMNGNAAEIVIADGAVVYLCKSAGAKCYHLKRDCRGLKRCRHMVEESDKETAENIGLTMCSYEN